MKQLLSLILMLTISHASIILDEFNEKVDHFAFKYYYDETNELDISGVQTQAFQRVTNMYTFGYEYGTFWFKLHIQNLSMQDRWILLSNEPYFEEMTLFRKKGEHWIEEKNGLQVLLKDKVHYYHKPMFILDFHNNPSQEFFLKVKGKLSSANDFKLMSQHYFNSIHGYCNDLLYMLFLGALIIIILLNLFIYYRLKEKIYLFYALYILFYGLWIYAYSGLVLYSFVDGHFYDFLAVIPLFVMFLILFSVEFLNINQYVPKLYSALKYLAFSFFGVAVFMIVSFNPWFQYMVYWSILAFSLMIILAIYLVFKIRDKNTKIYLFIMSIYLISILLVASMVNGWIENTTLTRYGFIYVSLFEILCFTAILTNRFYIFHQEKLFLQSQVIEMKNHNEELLEKEIQHRTKDVISLLNDKELLLKELYHRVKNNFQNVVGILWIEADKLEQGKSKEVLQKLISRIKSMALIHEFLYEQKTLNQIDAKEHIQNIIEAIEMVYQEENIRVKTNVESIRLSMNEANNLAIIINEVINNAIKHAKLEDICEIRLQLIKNAHQLSLLICDNGNGFDYTQVHRGLGLNLIEQFAHKLSHVDYKFYNDNGTCFELNFKLENEP